MDHPFPQKKHGKTRILVAPLDWGLGHATRCIPLIRELLAREADVWLAGEGAQERLLRDEFPALPFLALPGYRIKYAATARGLAWKMIGQTARMKKAIRQENKWLKDKVRVHGFDAVISDNRFGLYHDSVPCVFITHQLQIKTGLGAWTEKILRRWNYRYINRFTRCWVPDVEAEFNVAGDLSHPGRLPVKPVEYIGLLSRFEKKAIAEKKNHLLIILSGPEPQRTLLENMIIKEIAHYNGSAVIARGLPGDERLIPSTNMIKFYNHLPAAALNDCMQEAEYIIGRSGYSSIMDALALQKKMILVPTPGQTEQEYLATRLAQKGIALRVEQKDFSIAAALTMAQKFPYQIPRFPAGDRLRNAIGNLLSYCAETARG